MRIALDGTVLHDRRTWTGRLAPLFRALADEAPADSFVVLENWLRSKPDAVGRRNVARATARIPRGWLRRALALGVGVDRWTGPVDLYHSFTLHLPRRRRFRWAATVHDLAFRRDPAWFPAGEAERLAAATAAVVAEADVVLPPSAAVAAEIVDAYGLPPGKVDYFHWGVAPDFRPTPPDARREVLRRHGLDRPYVLALGTLEPRKNIPRLIEAQRLLRAEGSFDGDLVLAGAEGWGPPVPEAPGVRRIGRVADADLPALLGGAEAFAYVSLYEGFGIPVLEAMACGAVVVTSRGGACAETAGGAAVLVDPLDSAAIAEGLRHAVADSEARAACRRRGLERAAEMTWSATARGLLKVYRRLAA